MKKLTVRFERGSVDGVAVGTLVEAGDQVSFEYDSGFIDGGVELSPLRLPLKPGLVDHEDLAFGPLPGLFDDSLPDGWGLLLMDRHFRQTGVDVRKLSVLDRLAYLGTRTMGALTYHPSEGFERGAPSLDLSVLDQAARKVLQGESGEVLPQLVRAGGSPGGARPKVLVGIKGDEVLSGEDELPEGFEHWLVKFGSLADGAGMGRIEYAYSLMARAAGLKMCQTRLFFGGRGKAWFGTQRFDRAGGGKRRHVHSFGNLIQSNFRIPSCDYDQFLEMTLWLTRNHADLVRAFRWMVFNIATHNRDDHVKNFAFMLDDEDRWTLTPAYDLCFSEGIHGEHSMSVNGEGANPGREQVLGLAKKHGIKVAEAMRVIEEVNEAVGKWGEFADEAGCGKKEAGMVKKVLRQL
jgi:serine/threonine-protein kinase HipA